MQAHDLVQILKDILVDVFDEDNCDDLEITLASAVEDFDKWDSLAHIQIITQLEAQLDLKFTLTEIEEFDCIENIIKVITEKMTEA